MLPEHFSTNVRLCRRELLRASCGLGLSFLAPIDRGPLFADSVAAQAAPAKIRACIFVFYYGGPSHLDTFDMKPDAPAEVRGEFRPIATSEPGIFVSEHLPTTSRIMHKLAVVRSMHHTNRLHDSASIETFTGRQGPNGDREEFAPIPQFHPCHGAVLSYIHRHQKKDVAHAALPWAFHNVVDVPCQGGGYLGAAFDPFRIQGSPDTFSYQAELLQRPADLSLERIADRRVLLSKIADRSAGQEAAIERAGELRVLSDRAFDLLSSDAIRRALDVQQESATTRERYGMASTESAAGPTNGGQHGFGRNLRGQNLLLARRLVEAGVPYVNVYDFRQQGQNWDSHADNFGQHKNFLLPPADRALAALVQDLDERGLLESTLVIATGEFGRTPKINANAGRDHWPDCYSVVLAGGGVHGGFVFGASDKLAAYPALDPVTPADLAATIYWRFGVDPSTEIHDSLGRPHRLSDGRPIKSLFS